MADKPSKIEDLLELQKLMEEHEGNDRPEMFLSKEAWADFGKAAGLPSCKTCKQPKVPDEPCFVCASTDGVVHVPYRKVPKTQQPQSLARPMNRQQRRAAAAKKPN